MEGKATYSKMEEGNETRNIFAFGAKGWGISTFGIAFYYFFLGPLYGGTNFWFSALNQMFGWTTTQMSVPIFLAGIIAMLGIILWGGLTKKIGAKRVIVISLILGALSNLIFAFIPTLWAFGSSVILYYFCAAGYSVIGVGQLGADWFPRKKGLYMGIVTVGTTIQAATIPLILAILVPALGITLAMLIFSAVQVIIAILVAAFVKNTPEEAGAYPDNDKSVSREELLNEVNKMEEYKKKSPWTTKALLKSPTVWKIGVAWGVCMLCGIGVVQQIAQALASFGHNMMFGITILSAAWPVGILGHVLIGIVDHRIGTRNTSIFTALVMAMASLMVGLSGQNTVVAVVGTVLFLFSVSGMVNVTMSITTTAFGRQDFGNAWPIISTIFQLVSNFGVLTIAVLAAVLSYRITFGIAAMILVLAAIVMLTTTNKRIAPPVGAKVRN